MFNIGFPTVYKVVDKASDLPAVLEADTTYCINGTITTSQTITVTNENCQIIGFNRDKDALVYTGTGDFITVTDVNFGIQGVCITAGQTGARALNASNIDIPAGAPLFGRTKVFTLVDCQFRGCYNVMQITGYDLVDILNTLFWYNFGAEGCKFKSVSKLEITSCEFIRWFDEATGTTFSTGNMIDLGDAALGVGYGAINVTSSIIHPQQTQIGFNYPGAATDTTGYGTIASNTFVDVGLTTGAVVDIDYNGNGNTYVVEANQGLPNAKGIGTMILSGNALVTSISAANTPVKLNGGTAFTFPVASRVLTSNTGEITYNSKISAYFSVTVSLTAEVVSGGANQVCNFYLAANGSVIPFAKGSLELDNGVPLSLTFNITGFANFGDVYEVYVENTAGSNNILVSDLVLNGFSL